MKLHLKNYKSFVFTHIPKCGGSSFRHYLADCAINSGVIKNNIYIPETLGIKNNENLDQLNQEKLKKVAQKKLVILGDHSKFNVHRRKNLNIQSPFYFTILREPIKRVVSHYNHFYYDRGYGNSKDITLNELEPLRLRQILFGFNNLMVDYLSNRNPKIEPTITTYTLKRAIFNLENHFGCFAILENIDTSIKLLKKYSPSFLTFENNLPFENVSKTKAAPISEMVKDEIIKNNLYDIILYDYAVELFNMRYKIYSK